LFLNATSIEHQKQKRSKQIQQALNWFKFKNKTQQKPNKLYPQPSTAKAYNPQIQFHIKIEQKSW